MKSRVRIFIGPVEIAGYSSNLKKGFDSLGIKCDCVDFSVHQFAYEDFSQGIAKFIRRIHVKIQEATHSKYKKIFFEKFRTILILIYFFSILPKYNTFIYTSGASYFKLLDLTLLKLLGKKIIFIFNGTDHRPPYINGVFMSLDNSISPEECIGLTKKIKHTVQKIEKNADIVIAHHLSAQFHEKRFIPGLFIGMPYKLPEGIQQVKNKHKRMNGAVRILHAPSRPYCKGSDIIEKAIDDLSGRGYKIEFIKIINRPNREVLEEISRCDFVIDELYSDVRMAGLATEAAFLGKPSIVGGYASDEHLKIDGMLTSDQLAPVYYCHPLNIEAAIEKMIVDKDFRVNLGLKAREFVETHQSAKHVAEKILRWIEGESFDKYLYDPADIRYLYGFGLSEMRLKQVITSVINQGGVKALMLSDKPQLEKQFLDFVHILESNPR
ncbi:MAG: hypothetical protein JXB49_15900 [Bacteroidales bacterium]|nr:hypothetical protein [Bacteroidales bacterium]